MKPVLAILGRPNVGKSTLFNRLTRSRDAIVANQPGLTRDRQYGHASIAGRDVIVIDTGGLADDDDISSLISQQAMQAATEADICLLLVDGRHGMNATDEAVAARLRSLGKPVQILVNKSEGLDPDTICAEFHALGLGPPQAISAAHGQGVIEALEPILADLPKADDGQLEEPGGIRICVLGRPNVGKSTLVNRMLGEERVLTYDQAGTTRDSIEIPFQRDGHDYVLIDTAGVRRRGRINEAIEKFSVIKTIQALDSAHVAVLVIDAREGVADQDAGLLGMALDSGRGLVIAVNKWDGLDAYTRERVRSELERKLRFIDFARIHFISALHGSGVGKLFGSVQRAYQSAFVEVNTARLTQILEDAVSAHPPSLVRGRRIKLRYAHLGGHNPPTIVIHGNQTSSLPDAYRRYLAKTFRKALKLEGTPVRIETRTGKNPFAGRRNPLSQRQIQRKQRLMRHVKKR